MRAANFPTRVFNIQPQCVQNTLQLRCYIAALCTLVLSSVNIWASLAWIKCLCLATNLGVLSPLLRSLLLDYDANILCQQVDYHMQRSTRSTYPKFWHHISNGLWPLAQIQKQEEEMQTTFTAGSTVCLQFPAQIVQAVWYACVMISCVLLLVGVRLGIRNLALPWLSLNGINMALTAVNMLVDLIMWFYFKIYNSLSVLVLLNYIFIPASVYFVISVAKFHAGSVT
uniref:G-protein coupled receptors family 1 profile domain-containing protein n=1 Tax=Trichuris muris TaxID=70415 RepID=A0A5S6QHG6_TRIMR